MAGCLFSPLLFDSSENKAVLFFWVFGYNLRGDRDNHLIFILVLLGRVVGGGGGDSLTDSSVLVDDKPF